VALDPTAAFGDAKRTPPERGRPRPQQCRRSSTYLLADKAVRAPDLGWFRAPTHVRISEVSASHEPHLLSPSLSSIRNGGEGVPRAREEAQRFMGQRARCWGSGTRVTRSSETDRTFGGTSYTSPTQAPRPTPGATTSIGFHGRVRKVRGKNDQGSLRGRRPLQLADPEVRPTAELRSGIAAFSSTKGCAVALARLACRPSSRHPEKTPLRVRDPQRRFHARRLPRFRGRPRCHRRVFPTTCWSGPLAKAVTARCGSR
jgi:hypothetical protein